MLKSELYTYQEILNLFPSLSPQYPHQSDVSAEWFSNILLSLSMKYDIVGISTQYTDADIKAIVNSLMMNVYNRHSEDIVLKVDSYLFDLDYVLSTIDAKKVLSKILNVLNLTLPRYLPLLKKYKEVSVDPIAPIKSSSTGKTRFNDTPQDSGEFDDDSHTTNITSSESESVVDTGSLMERLSAVYENYRSIILEWSNEFNQCFFKEEQFL